ncbi:redoxin domain-containing protein [Dissulfurispira thermophila]|uniref:redoxin domain-containing protein n=1 Tax=Dissulfurispira thermophila TaxID=2715679 RepID=UPI001A911590|nr:redoxin domain-containing protein [Dissulfurispira thermophila]
MKINKEIIAKISLTLLPFSLFLCLYLFALPISTQALLTTGTQAPDFTLKDIDGRAVSLSQYFQKKAVIVLFWSTRYKVEFTWGYLLLLCLCTCKKWTDKANNGCL